MYKAFEAQVMRARARSSAFYRVDLHLHSHDSDDFPKIGDKPGCTEALGPDDKAATPKHFIEAGKRAGLRLMAITDHNRSRVAEQIAALQDADITVLPGMEVSVRVSFLPDSVIHLLTIFPENFTSNDIERLFARGGMPIVALRNKSSVLDMHLRDVLEAVQRLGGICIASHVNSSKGLRTLFRDNNTGLLKLEMRKKDLQRRRKEGLLSPSEQKEYEKLQSESRLAVDAIQNQYLCLLSEYKFDAVEVQRGRERAYYSGVHVSDLGIDPISCVVGSDAHNLTDIGLPGQVTYVKMTKPGFTDLHRALRDPGVRIRFEDDLQPAPVARVLGIQFEGGFFEAHTIGFSDNLTCLIGGRGSGKSATIEALRHVFARDTRHLSKEKAADIQGRLDFTLIDTDVRVLFSDGGGDRYVLKRRYGEKRTCCFELDGTLRQEVDIAAASNLAVKIYGWGEIEELARSKREQLVLIDGFVPGSLQAVESVQDLMKALEDNTRQVVALAKDIQLLLPRVAELPTKKMLLTKLTSELLDALFSSFDRNQRAQSAVSTLAAAATGTVQRFVQEDGAPIRLLPRLEEPLVRTESDIRAYPFYNEFFSAYSDLARIAALRYTDLLSDLREITELIGKVATRLLDEAATIEAELNKAAELAESSNARSSLSKRKTLTEEVSMLDAVQAEIDQKHSEIKRLLSDRWDRLVPELRRQRRALTRLRQARLKGLNRELSALASGAKVTVRIRHQKERGEFIRLLGSDEKGAPDGILKHVNKLYLKDKYSQLYAASHDPHSFVRAVMQPGDTQPTGLRARVIDENGHAREVITMDKARDVKRHLDPRIPDSIYFDPERLRQLLELEHALTNDLPQIALDGKPIEELSPGQRCSALLPIILLESSCPVIIDQPEDNLDNRLVFGLVVDIIRALKERRQIIVATHNPNIPVSGDAEQIVVFNSLNRHRCEQILQGSIDCEDIVDQVKAIMEGSEEAFRIRASKYGYRLPFGK